jgi:hypothetical protein
MVSYAQLMNMSKKIKPNELKMISSKSDSAKTKPQGETVQHSQTKSGDSKLKRKISETSIVKEYTTVNKRAEDKRRLVTEPSRKRPNVQPGLNSQSKRSDSATAPQKIRKVAQEKAESSSRNLSKRAPEKKAHFSLNPYAIDPSDPLIQGGSLNISSYIGNLFGYSKDRYLVYANSRFKDDYTDTKDMESSYANMRREEQRS